MHRTSRACFSSCAAAMSHYKTLSVPKNASKSQIKSSFYKLSKLYHPDVTQDPAAKEKFQAVSEAYATLGDDRKRRAYDRTLVDDTRHSHPTQHYDSPFYDTTRRRGATHAWQQQQQHPRPSHMHHRWHERWHAHRPNCPGSGGHYQRPHTDPGGVFRDRGPDPFASPNVQRATGMRRDAAGRRERERMEMDRVNNISTFWRTVQVVGVVLFVAAIGGGFRADAS